MKYLCITLSALFCAATLAQAADVRVPVDPNAATKLEEIAKGALTEGNYARAIRTYRQLLEVYPNEPALHAPIYAAMASAASMAGDQAQADEFHATAKALDSGIDRRENKVASSAVTRGGNGGKADAALSIVSAALQGYVAYRATRAAQTPVPPPQPVYAPPPAVAPPVYPQAAYGQPQYAPPPNYNAAMPGYAPPDPNMAAQQMAQQMPQQVVPPPMPQQLTPDQLAQQQMAQQYPQPMPQQQMPQQQMPQQAMIQQAMPQQAMPQQQMPPGAGGPFSQTAPPATYPAAPTYANYAPPPTDPYRAPARYQAPARRMRGEAAPVIRVVHDHSRAGDDTYFGASCGALLTVEAGALILTPGGGEAPRIIPQSEIREIRLNTLVGRDIGAFHIATRRGLYLQIAPQNATRDEGRQDVDSLRQQLALE